MNVYRVMIIFAFFLSSTCIWATPYGGIEFPQGSVSFADEVVLYQPAADVGSPHNNPLDALGIPNYDSKENSNYVSLGDEGVIVLRFTDNSLTTSWSNACDLWVFEIGGATEPTAVAISKDGITWINVGATSGSTSGVDIDAYVGAGVILGDRYSYVRLTDLLPHQSGGDVEGADIDAVGAISSAPAVPVPGAIWLLGSGLFGLLSIRKRLSR